MCIKDIGLCPHNWGGLICSLDKKEDLHFDDLIKYLYEALKMLRTMAQISKVCEAPGYVVTLRNPTTIRPEWYMGHNKARGWTLQWKYS